MKCSIADMKCSIAVHEPGCPRRMSCRPPSQNICWFALPPSFDAHWQHTLAASHLVFQAVYKVLACRLQRDSNTCAVALVSRALFTRTGWCQDRAADHRPVVGSIPTPCGTDVRPCRPVCVKLVLEGAFQCCKCLLLAKTAYVFKYQMALSQHRCLVRDMCTAVTSIHPVS